ncbi:MAG TPA: hydroxyacid dehydrogenase [Clostridiales bacterium]|nr:hydroxyacid dehydrogenase [Clostridiales bacterium]
MNEKSLDKTTILETLKPYDMNRVNTDLDSAMRTFQKKIIVLDDDPTGVQTVNDIYVYTDWSKESIRQGFDDDKAMFFILTNSRGFTKEETRRIHTEIAKNIVEVSKETGKDFVVISRSDSTLRGHYPIETLILKGCIEEYSSKKIDGEIIIPFFVEGGRYTINNVHYVADGNTLVPAASTEFAADKTFGYSSSDLREWIEEKTEGKYTKDRVTCISLSELRDLDYEGIQRKLEAVTDFNKVVVNAVDYADVKVFVTALVKVMEKKNFIFRTAAALPRVIGQVCEKGLLTKDELVNTTNRNGGFIIVGSHVNKTTQQLERLKELDSITFIEFNCFLVVDEQALEQELTRVIRLANENIKKGKTVAVYTRRERFDVNSGNNEDDLRLAVKISEAVTRIASSITVRPNFIIAKGGITSSDVGTKALGVKKALVLGQILPGIPVWMTGAESRFPNMPYVIFPGNVGNETGLRDAVEIMQIN